MSKKDQLRSDEEESRRLQAEFDESKIEADHELAQRLQAEEQEELSVEEKAKLFQQLLEQRRKHFAAKTFKRVITFVDFKTNLVKGSSKRAGEELEQESTKKQKVDEDKDTTELQSLMEVIPDEEEVAINAIPLVFSQLLKNVDREDLVELYKLVKAKYGSTRPVEDMDLLL
ncbi:hypothetical protein Tco_0486915 [Tanacetum coccineum]